VHPTQISHTLHGRLNYPGTRKKICREIGLSEADVFENGRATFLRLLRQAEKEVAA